MKPTPSHSTAQISPLTLTPTKKLILGLQHLFAMFGATVLVPILVNGYFEGYGLSVQVTLFCAGAGTLFFHFLTGWKVPAFLGSSFAFLGGFATVAALDAGTFAGLSMAEKLPYATGGIVIAGALYFILAALIILLGRERVMRFLPPEVTGPIIICIGITLAPSAISNCSANWPLAIIAAAVAIVCSKWGRGMIKIIPILLGVVVAYVAAIIMQAAGITNADGSAIIDATSIASSSWAGLPPFFLPKFDLSAILMMAPVALAAMMEHIGDISAISATVDKDFLKDPGLHRTLVGDGLATALAGVIGGPANTTYGENTGVLALSGVHDPAVIRVAAVFAVVLSFIPKLSSIFGTMPTAIVGGISLVLYGMISGVGIKNLVDHATTLQNLSSVILIGVIMVIGIGVRDNVVIATVRGTPIELTPLALAAIVGIGLNAIFVIVDACLGHRSRG